MTNNVILNGFFTFFKIGLFTSGGGYAMIPLIEAEIVDKKKWISKEDFWDLLAVAQSCPGVFAINISVFVGYRLRGLAGGILCALGTALPSFLIILLIAIFFRHFKENPYVAAMFRGIRPAVVALIAVPTFNLAKKANLNGGNTFKGGQEITRDDVGTLLNVTNALGDSFFQINQRKNK